MWQQIMLAARAHTLTLYSVFNIVSVLMEVLSGAIFIYALLSWFRPQFRLYEWLENIVTPFIAPFRALSDALMRRTSLPLDLSCWFAVIGLQIINFFWWKLYYILRLFFRH